MAVANFRIISGTCENLSKDAKFLYSNPLHKIGISGG
jgi:hypothetical protein